MHCRACCCRPHSPLAWLPPDGRKRSWRWPRYAPHTSAAGRGQRPTATARDDGHSCTPGQLDPRLGPGSPRGHLQLASWQEGRLQGEAGARREATSGSSGSGSRTRGVQQCAHALPGRAAALLLHQRQQVQQVHGQHALHRGVALLRAGGGGGGAGQAGMSGRQNVSRNVKPSQWKGGQGKRRFCAVPSTAKQHS